MPVPGTVELGVVSIGALWLQGDSAGKHLVVAWSPKDADFVLVLSLFSEEFYRFCRASWHSVFRLKSHGFTARSGVVGGCSASTTKMYPQDKTSQLNAREG